VDIPNQVKKRRPHLEDNAILDSCQPPGLVFTALLTLFEVLSLFAFFFQWLLG
jgi:hypothetical protein